MPELHDLLERRARGYEPPHDLIDRVRDRSRRRELKGRVGAGLTAAVILASFAFGAWISMRSSPTESASPGDIPIEQGAIIRQVVDAANGRDQDALASSFTDDGTFSPFVEWGTRQPGEVIPTWMENVEAWDLEALVRSCKSRAEATVTCDVRTRWHILRMEMAERWTFSFEGRQLESLVMVRSDTDATDRALPFGYSDLVSWESWLEETHPEQAAVLLADSPLIATFLRYDPTLADEIGASIQEYLEIDEG